MKQLTLALLFLSSLALGQDKIVVKQLVESGNEDGTEVEVTVKNNVMTIEVEKDGKEETYRVDLNNDFELKSLMEKLSLEGVDIDLFDAPRPEKMVKSRGYLGVGLSDLTDQLKTYFGADKNGGVLVNNVSKDSPAEKAGLKAGDVIIKADDVNIESSYDLSKYIKKQKPGTEVNLTILRKSRQRKVTTTLGEYKGFDLRAPAPPAHMMWKDKQDLSNMFFFSDGEQGHPGEHQVIMRKMKSYEAQKDLKEDMEKMKKELQALKEELKKIKE